MTKTVHIIDTKHNDFKSIKKHYKDIETRLEDGKLVITNPPFSDHQTVVVVDLSQVESVHKLGEELNPHGEEFHLSVSKITDVSSLTRGIVIAHKDAGRWKEEPPKPLPKVYSDGKEVTANKVEGTLLARELVNTPSNFLTPFLYAQRIKKEFANVPNMYVDVIGQRDLEQLGMNTLLSVGQGSDEDSYVVIMEYRGNPNNDIELALVGKGVTFDTGGISLKPGSKMHEMKMDMGGIAAVVGAMKDISTAGMKVNVVGIVGLVENMPSGKAIKPGDVVMSYKGLTVENHNTDAEGRLVLCDLLAYVQDRYTTVNKIVDVATLTGAIVVSLADQYAGLFTNSTDFGEEIRTSSTEKFWRMPMGKEFAKQLESNVADMKNIGNGHPGSTTAAEFLYKFVNDDVAWAHLDIAGMAWDSKGNATGFGVETLTNVAMMHSNDKYNVDEDMKY